MSIPENEVAAANQRRRMEETSISPVGGKIGESLPLLTSALAVGKSLVGHGDQSVTAIAVTGGIIGTLGIADWFRKLGNSKVSENLDILSQATEDALRRVEDTLSAHGTSIDEIKTRVESPEFKAGMASAALQALRTTQEGRIKRLAQILAGGVAENDLESESLDDMMRAAVELKESDVVLLGKLYDSQSLMLKEKGLNPQKWHGDIQGRWKEFVNSGKLNPSEHLNYRSSFSRLESAGLIQRITSAGDYGVGHEIYALVREGERFYEHLREIKR